MAAKIVVDSSVLIKWVKTKDEDLVNLLLQPQIDQSVRGNPLYVPPTVFS